MKHLYRSGILLLIAVMSLLAACKKPKSPDVNDPTTTNTETLTAEKVQVMAFEIAIIQVNGISPQSGTYTGSFGGQPVTIVYTDSTLGFMVPGVEPGSQDLSVNIDGKDYYLGFEVMASPAIADPAQYVQEKVSGLQFSDQEIDDVKIRLAGYPGAEDIVQQMEKLKAVYADMNSKLAQATPEDKIAAAKFIAANPDLFAKPVFGLDLSGLDLFRSTAGSDNAEKIARDLDVKIKNYVKLLKVGVIISLAATATGNVLVAALGSGATIGLLYNANSYLIESTGKSIERFGDILIQQKSTSGDIFLNDTYYVLDITSEYKNLNNSTASSGSSVFLSLAASLNTFGSFWSKILGSFPQWMVGSAFHFKNVSTQSSKELNINPSYLSIENISNNNVTATVDKANGFKVKFSTTQTSDQSFTYDVVYNASGFASHTETMSGTVTNDACDCNNTTAPVIDNIAFVCDQGDVSIMVTFHANGQGILMQGSYSGPGDENSLTSYPVRVYMRPQGSSDWSIYFNSYSVELVSGNVNNGVLKINYQSFVNCMSEPTPEQSFHAYYYHDYQIKLMNCCNQRGESAVF